MRLFIAVGLSSDVKRAVGNIQDKFRRQQISGNFTPRDNLHITLAFIGEYSDPDRVLEALESVSFYPFSIKMDRVGSFGDLWWMGFEDSRELESVVRRVRHALADAGIPFDNKKFRAHVTILRKPQYYRGSIPHSEMETVSMKVESISLMQSVRGKNGMIYTELGKVKANME